MSSKTTVDILARALVVEELLMKSKQYQRYLDFETVRFRCFEKTQISMLMVYLQRSISVSFG